VSRSPLTVALLLTDPSPCLRLRVLTELVGKPSEDAEVRELRRMRVRDPAATGLLSQEEGGSTTNGSATVVLGFELARLGFLGFDQRHTAVSTRAGRLFALQRADGSWPLPRGRALDPEQTQGKGYDAIPLQTALPLRGLAACGYAQDPRAEKAYAWLEGLRLEDGSWPSGLASGVFGRVAGYRRLPQSRWGCRTNTTAVLQCLARHPKRRSDPAAARGLDHLLARETRDRSQVGVEVARLCGALRPKGFFTYHAPFDAALLLDLVGRVGASREDDRVSDLVAFVQRLRGEAGLWELGSAPTASRWLSLDLLLSLARIQGSTDWLSLAPRTAYMSYPRGPRRN
jgi:hypothetical protein